MSPTSPSPRLYLGITAALMFLNPWAITFGLLAAALPLAVHWLTRPRPIRLPLSTWRFVEEVVAQRRARHRLRDWLVLLLRTLAVLLLAFAIARPLFTPQPLLSAVEPGSTVRIVVLDTSQSMGAVSQGVQTFERARTRAAEYLASRPGLRVNLILAGAVPQPVFEHPAENFAAIRDALTQAHPRPERSRVQTALYLAAEMLTSAGDDPNLRRELVVISDFQRANWAAADFSPVPADVLIQLEAVASSSALPNVAIQRIGAERRPEAGREFRIEVEVGNWSAEPRQLNVELELGRATHQLEGSASPGATTTLSTEILLDAPGWQTGRARLPGLQDGLTADNARPLAIEIHPPPTYLLLTRQDARQQPSSSYYLERALVPFSSDDEFAGRAELEKLVRVDPVRLDRETAALADVILLDHPGRLPAETVELLATLLRHGRGMLYITAERLDAANLAALAAALGSDLQLPVQFVPPATNQARRDLFLADVQKDAPPFDIFGDDLQRLTDPLRFSGGLGTRRLESGVAEEITATFSDGSAALVVTNCGAGLLAILNTNLEEGSLPRSPLFVPLLGELTALLLGRSAAEDALPGGEPAAVYLPGSITRAVGLRIVAPRGTEADAESLGELVNEKIGVLWRIPAAGPTGVYEVQRDGRAVFALATAAPAEESDLSTLSPEVIQERLIGGRQRVSYRSAGEPEDRRDSEWAWFLAACVACLCGEILTLGVFRS